MPSKTVSLPVLADDYRKLARLPVGIDDIARDPDLNLTSRAPIYRDQRHLAVVVDLGEAGEHGRTELLHGAHEAQVLGFGRKRADERLLDFSVFGTDWPDRDLRPALGLPFRDQPVRIRMYRHVLVRLRFCGVGR